MCGVSGYKDFYQYESGISDARLIVCKKCAIREYYGTKGTQTKKYKKEKTTNKIFGKEILGN